MDVWPVLSAGGKEVAQVYCELQYGSLDEAGAFQRPCQLFGSPKGSRSLRARMSGRRR